MKLFTLLIALLFVNNALAAGAMGNLPPDFSPARWAQIKQKAIQEGKRASFGDSLEYRHLDIIVPNDPTIPRQADYFSVIGYTNGANFGPDYISLVSESWTLNENDHWNLDQWIFDLTLDGSLFRIIHAYHRMDRHGRVYESRRHKTGLPSDPSELARMGELLSKFY